MSTERPRGELTQAFRVLNHRPLFAVAVIMSLAVGIGGWIFAISIVYSLRLPLPEPDRLAQLYAIASWNCPSCLEPVSYDAIRSWRPVLKFLHGLSAYQEVTLRDDDQQPRRGAVVDASFFRVLGVRPARGRLLEPGDHEDGAPLIAVVSHRLWRRALGGVRDLAEARLTLEGRNYAVVGVTPRRFGFPPGADFWLSISAPPTLAGTDQRVFTGIARVREGATLAAANVELRSVLADVPESRPGGGARLVAFTALMRGTGSEVSWMLACTVAVFVLVICANLAMLSSAQTFSRHGEVAVRRALGAQTRDIWRSFLLESSILAAAGVFGGLALVKTVGSGLSDWLSTRLDGPVEVAVNDNTIWPVALVAVLTSLALAAGPTLMLTRADIQPSLRGTFLTSRTGTGSRRHRAAFVAMQVAIAFTLLVASVLIAKSWLHISAANLGVDANDVEMMSIDSPSTTDMSPLTNLRTDELRNRLLTLPGVERVAFWSLIKIHRSYRDGVLSQPPVAVSGDGDIPRLLDNLSYPFYYLAVSDDFFHTLGLRLLAGRYFSAKDRGTPVAIINEAFARRFWPNKHAVGETVKVKTPESPQFTVVGVVGNSVGIDESGLAMAMTHSSIDWPNFFVPLSHVAWPTMKVAVRFRPDSPRALETLWKTTRVTLRGAQVDFPSTLRDRMLGDRQLESVQVAGELLAFISMLATAITLLGVYTLTTDTVRARARELAIREALGATAGSVERLVVGQTLAACSVGVVAGFLISIGGTHIFERALYGHLPGIRLGLLYGVSATEPSVYVLAVIALYTVVLLSAVLAVKRTTRLAPVRVMRSE